jgi:hypothetical protein
MGIGSPTAKAQGQGYDIESLNEQVEQLYNTGQYAEATEKVVVQSTPLNQARRVWVRITTSWGARCIPVGHMRSLLS